MRPILAASVAALVLIAGCSDSSSSSLSCPEEYGSEYEEQYRNATEAYEEATGEELLDTDGDCVPDASETVFGTDPANATSYPSPSQIQDFINGTMGNVTPPLVVHGPATGTVTSAVVVGVGGAALSWNVDAGATLLFAEIQWDDPVQDLDLALASPSAGTTQGVQNYDHQQEGGAPGMPDSPHSLTVTSPETGTWMASAFANGAAVQLSYDVVVTVFYGATTVPEGYTAFA